MHILTVIPISRGISKDTLTYFTNKDVAIGSIVSIPIRSKKGFGLVIKTESASNLKSELKTLSYSIKKIENITARGFLLDSFIQSAQKIADYNAASVGAVLSALIPKTILENSAGITYTEPKIKASGTFHETSLLQSEEDERYATYKGLIREEFAKGRSVFFCLPTTEDLQNSTKTLEKGIEKYTYTLHSGLPKKKIIEIWKEIITEDHPVLIIATGSFLSIPRSDLGTIILEKESSRGYKMQTRPFIDLRTAAEIMAKELNIRLVVGDILLRIETLWEEKNQTKTNPYSELSPLKFRSLTTAECEIASMRIPRETGTKEFTILGDKLKRILQMAVGNNERTFLFCSRKGLYPVTVCSDCGTVVICKNCNAPVVLYGSHNPSTKAEALRKNKNLQNKNLFVCHHCGERRDAQELCIHCNGWRLTPLGIGIDRAAEILVSIFGKEKVTVMDKDRIRNHREAVKVRDKFYNTPGGILVGTEMALTYLNGKIENSGIISIDSYFSIPDFQINEKIFHILLLLRSLTEKHMIVQTRQESASRQSKILDYAIHGNLVDFYRDEIEDRKSIGYPPFATYVKISLEGEKSAIKKQMAETQDSLKPYELQIYDAFNPGSKSKYTIHGLISLPKGKWVNGTLLQKLRSLPGNFSVRIDPITLL